MGTALLLSTCYGCKGMFTSCPDCVNTIRVDPETGLPPDVTPDRKHNPNPDPEAVRRSVKEPVCDNCIRTRNATNPDKVTLWEERHKRNHF